MVQSHPTFPAYSFTDAAIEVTASQVKYGDDPDQILEFYGESDSRKPTLFLIHGGYWRNIFDREHMRPLAVALAKRGYLVVLPEFRRVAGDPDTTLRDLSFALSTLEENKVTLIGYSSGGHLAMLLADKFPLVTKVIGLAPVLDLVESQSRELGRAAVREWLGRDAQEFLASEIGRYLLGRAQMDEREAMEALVSVKWWRRRRIIELQSRIYRARSVRSWLAEIITDGRQAESVLEEL